MEEIRLKPNELARPISKLDILTELYTHFGNSVDSKMDGSKMKRA